MLELFPKAKIAIGPPIEHGFYYDFDLPRPLTQEDLEQIEARMKELIAQKLDFEYEEIDPEAARELSPTSPTSWSCSRYPPARHLTSYRRETGEPVLSIYRSAPSSISPWPHVANTKEINPKPPTP